MIEQSPGMGAQPVEVTDDRVTRMIIKKNDNIPALNDPGYWKFPAKPIYMHRDNGSRALNYYDIRNLSNTKCLEILLHDGEALKTVDLPGDLSQKIADFLRIENSEEHDFDCKAFVNLANGLPKDYKFDEANWDFLPFDDPQPGDCILLASEEEEGFSFRHVAVALGDDLFLSQLGLQTAGGRLGVMTLQGMMNGYHADHACRIVPKANPEASEEVASARINSPS